MEKENVTAKSYTLLTENGAWLGQVVLTNDGMFASVTDYGNLSFAWRAYGQGKDFREFMVGLNIEYFGGKMFQGGNTYTAKSQFKNFNGVCINYAEKILPALQKVLKEELEKEKTASTI